MDNLKLYNSLSRKIEEFKPINPSRVGIYTCGPTVHDYQHIGNFRTMFLADILLRVLQEDGYEVISIRNITDIEDKIIKKAKERNQPIEEFTKEYEKIFFDDLEKLNILPVNVNPRATEHIQEMIKYIQVLIDKGLAYVEKDGSVYFNISKYPDYGKLSGVELRKLKTGTRTLSDEYTKDNVQDFALWKSAGANEVGYDSTWGRGRPGWHIECSVMSQEYLGNTFDIHVGGVDLLFPHHENEIAQSEGATGKPFALYFVHGEHMLVEGQKMSKSLKNFYTLKDVEEKGFDPMVLRYLYLTAHWRDKLNFTWKSLEAAANGFNNLREEIRNWDEPNNSFTKHWDKFLEAANNDLNMPQALAIMWDLVRSDRDTESKGATLLKMDKILGLELVDYLARPIKIPKEVQELVEKREHARNNQDFHRADQIRKQIEKLGFRLEDTPKGPRVKSL